METKEYPIPDDVMNLFDDKNAASGLRDVYAKLPFGFKKASKCARESERLKTKAWTKVFEVYPELRGDFSLSYAYGVVTIIEGAK